MIGSITKSVGWPAPPMTVQRALTPMMALRTWDTPEMLQNKDKEAPESRTTVDDDFFSGFLNFSKCGLF